MVPTSSTPETGGGDGNIHPRFKHPLTQYTKPYFGRAGRTRCTHLPTHMEVAEASAFYVWKQPVHITMKTNKRDGVGVSRVMLDRLWIERLAVEWWFKKQQPSKEFDFEFCM